MLNAFKNLSIRLKLLCGFGVIGFLLIIIGGLSIVGMNRLNGNAEFIYKTNLLGVTVMSDLRAQMLRRSNFVIWHILANDSATMAAREKSITELIIPIDFFNFPSPLKNVLASSRAIIAVTKTF